MSDGMQMDWSKFITVDSKWVSDHLTDQSGKSDDKLTLRIYSVKFQDIKYSTAEFVAFVKESIKNYVLSKIEIEALERNGQDAMEDALQYFGDIDPTYDGKFGELILYLLTEAVLKVPMVAFKIPLSPKDQVKGADGIFLGDYNRSPAILLGEAKTWGSLDGALTSAFESLNRFHDAKAKSGLKFEFMVARKGLRADITGDELNHMYDCLILGSTENQKRILVHPVLIIYDFDELKSLSATTNEEIEKKLKEIITQKIDENCASLKKLCGKYTEVGQVHLDFFLIPLLSVDVFRKDLYFAIHGQYPKKARKRKLKKQKAK